MTQVQISEVLAGIRRFVGDHAAGNYCVSTGPITGTIADFTCVICEADNLANRIEAHGIAPHDGCLLVPSPEFHNLIFWLDRCDDKGHLDNCPDLIEPLADFNKAMLAATPKQEVKP